MENVTEGSKNGKFAQAWCNTWKGAAENSAATRTTTTRRKNEKNEAFDSLNRGDGAFA